MGLIAASLHVYLVVQLLSALSLPLTRSLFFRLPDRGYCLNKAVGILTVGLVLWLGTAWGLLRNDAGGAWISLALLAIGAILVGRSHAESLSWLRRNLSFVALAESLFLIAFGTWTVVRYLDPAIHHTEQPMDFMMMNAIYHDPLYPPQDPWLAGYPIAYYYLGYWLMNAVARLAGITPDLGYNILQACWYSLLILGSFGIGYNICRVCCRRDPNGRHRAVLGGLLSALSVGVVGNLGFVRDLLLESGSLSTRFGAVLGSDWWWRSSRVVTDRGAGGEAVEIITEFPAFSYVLGDNHPHLLAMPFLLVVLGFAFELFRGGGGRLRWIAAALLSGAFLFLNAWDYPLSCMVLVAAFFAGGKSIWRSIRFALTLPVIAILVYFPYLLTAQSQVGGIAFNLENPTALSQGAIMFGIFLPGCAALLASGSGGLSGRMGPGVFLPVLLPCVGALILRPGSLLGVGALALGATVLSLQAHLPRRSGVGIGIPLLFLAAGLAFVLAPELVYVVDLFRTRMNTVFKFYYQGWLLLAVASACGIAIGFRRGFVPTSLAATGLLALTLGLPFPALALQSKEWGEADRGLPSAIDQLRRVSATEATAIEWVREHVPHGALVLEAEGQSYRADQNRVSAFTGRATLLGWAGHEHQWRGREGYAVMAAGRSAALETIYRSGAGSGILDAIDRFRVDYVYVGPVERAKHGVDRDREGLFETLMDPVFSSGDVRIYRTRREIDP